MKKSELVENLVEEIALIRNPQPEDVLFLELTKNDIPNKRIGQVLRSLAQSLPCKVFLLPSWIKVGKMNSKLNSNDLLEFSEWLEETQADNMDYTMKLQGLSALIEDFYESK